MSKDTDGSTLKDLALKVSNDITEDIDGGETRAELRDVVRWWADKANDEARRRIAAERSIELFRLAKGLYDRLAQRLLDTDAALTEMRERFRSLRGRHTELVDRWNALVRQINDMGGSEFLAGKRQPQQLTRDEIDAIIKLVHPDKRGGSKQANDVTARLLTLRREAR